MSWTTPKFEKLGPMPGGKQGEERQGSNEGQSNDARNADTEGDVELPPLLEDFENEENLLSDDDKNSVDNSGSGGSSVCSFGSGGSESRGSSDGSIGSAYSCFLKRAFWLWFVLNLQFTGRFWFIFLQRKRN